MSEENKATMIARLKRDLSFNFKDGDDSILSDFIDDYISIASNNSNRCENDKKLYPYVYNAVIKAYIRRGNEGITQTNESGFSTSYEDIEEKLKKEVRAIRLVR